MNFSLYLSFKYFKFRAGERGISAIGVIALLTIIVSCAASVVVLSASNGLHDNYLKKILAKDAHIEAVGGIEDYNGKLQKILSLKSVKSAFPYYEKQALVRGSLNLYGSVVMGIPQDLYSSDPDFPEQFKMEQGTFDLSRSKNILMGYNLALNLGASMGDIVDVTVYSDEFGSLTYQFKVAGIFSAGNKDYDSSLSFISFDDAQRLFGSPGSTYGIKVKLTDPWKSEKMKDEIAGITGTEVFTWQKLHRSDLASLGDEKMLLLVILCFFFIVVGFNILSMMIGMVLDKKEEIGILKAVGMTPSDTRSAFLLNGFFMGVLGSLAGIILGILFTLTLNDILHGIEAVINALNSVSYLLANSFRRVPPPETFQFFNPSVYYITQFPLLMQLEDILFLLILSVLLSTSAVLFPAGNAAKFRPVEVLRHD